MTRLSIARLIARAAPARLVRDFGRDDRGLSAIEFALVLPLMVFIYLASVDTTLVLTADRRVTSIASSVGDLVSQARQLSAADMDDIFVAGTSLIEPMSDTTLSIVVTSVVADEDGNTTVDWSQAHNGSAGTSGAPFTLPEGIIEPNGSVVVATVSYSYASPVAQFITGDAVTLDEVFYLRPRRTTQIEFLD